MPSQLLVVVGVSRDRLPDQAEREDREKDEAESPVSDEATHLVHLPITGRAIMVASPTTMRSVHDQNAIRIDARPMVRSDRTVSSLCHLRR
ncbi:hypothetical protein BEP68_08390 [Microbacterium sp. 4-7]|nr:hypothetical protein [Microbacterium sp. 4-7]